LSLPYGKVKKLKIINVNSSDVKEDVQLLLGLGEGDNASVGEKFFHTIPFHSLS
jgi:hypothetical protein